jgi:hypothetical protein
LDSLFEVAYFWRIDPGNLLNLPMREYELYRHQALRLAAKINPEE